MNEASIPVDLFNPGQVFACLGFLEAADMLLDDAEGRFDWSDPADVRFRLITNGDANPFGVVLGYLANATPLRYAPIGFVESSVIQEGASEDGDDSDGDEDDAEVGLSTLMQSEAFPSASGDATSLPIFLRCSGYPDVAIGHWADGSSRNTFKLYSGNRSAEKIARAMVAGTRAKPKKGQTTGDLKTRGISHLWVERREELIENPFLSTPLGGSFNFDPRGAWTALDAGYSPNTQKHQVASSPVVQMLSAWGLEHARPFEFGVRQVRYAAWGEMLPPMLARAALSGRGGATLRRIFRFELALSGKNKIVTFSRQEDAS